MTTDPEGRNPLHYVAVDHPAKKHVGLAKKLVKKGADPSLADDRGWTPLHFAADRQALDLVRYLLSLGVEVDVQDTNGNTPLFNAVFSSRGEGEVIGLLREHGADPYRENFHEQTPVGLARLIANYPVAQFFADLPES